MSIGIYWMSAWSRFVGRSNPHDFVDEYDWSIVRSVGWNEWFMRGNPEVISSPKDDDKFQDNRVLDKNLLDAVFYCIDLLWRCDSGIFFLLCTFFMER